MGNPLRRLKRPLVFLQTGWSIFGITLVALLLTEAGFRMIFTVRDRLSALPVPDRRVLVEGYHGADWPREHYRELELLEDRWQPYVYFRQKPFRGKTVAIDAEGLRATWQPPPERDDGQERKRFKILMLGGSSLWGFGARDEQTIPSLLARTLHERGWRVELKNMSEIGYVSTQEAIALYRELQAGYRPSVVIFYDGVNDTTSAFLGGQAGLTTNEINRREEFNLLQRPVRLAAALAGKLVKDSGSYRFAQSVRRRFEQGTLAAQPALSKDALHELADGVVDRYAANLGLVAALGRGFGFRPLFYWQPVVFTKPVLAPFEREEARKYGWTERMFGEVYARVRASTELQANPAFHDLSGIFADSKNLVFIDYCHIVESANERIAAEMAKGVIEALMQPSPKDQKRGAKSATSSLEGTE
jgi:lysophospholipase L1-like esterase